MPCTDLWPACTEGWVQRKHVGQTIGEQTNDRASSKLLRCLCIGQRVLSIRLLAIPELRATVTPKRRDSVASPRRHNSPPHVASPRLRDCATPALYCATSQHRHTKTSPHINKAMVASASGSDRRPPEVRYHGSNGTEPCCFMDPPASLDTSLHYRSIKHQFNG